jgi:hypothetical protein
MTLNVETGTGAADSDAYASLEDCSTYTQARGLTFPTSPAGPAEAAIIRATAAIDATYRSRFSGEKLNGRGQALEWPRKYATDASGSDIDIDEVPFEIVEATCEAAVRELASPGAMMPDLERGGQIKALSAGSVSIEYGSNAEARTTFSLIDGILSGLIGGGNSCLFGQAVRG